MRRLIVTIAISLLSISPIHYAYGADLDGVRNYLRTTKATIQFKAGVNKAISESPGRPVPPAVQWMLSLSDQKLEDLMVPVYVEVWGAEHTDQITGFLGSDPGKEFIEQALLAAQGTKPQMTTRTISAVQEFLKTQAGERFTKSGPELQQKLWAAIAKLASSQ
jgi:hypothetical protein